MIIYIDIDDTICYRDDNTELDYSKSKPITEAINKANQLFDKGHTIIYWTARGTMTGIDWSEVTKKQLSKWGVKYNELKFGKPAYDLFIDDKNMNSDKWWEKLDDL